MKKVEDIADAPIEQRCSACECSLPAGAFWPGARRCKRCIITVSAREAAERDRQNGDRKAAEPPKRRGRKAAAMTAAPTVAPALVCEPVAPTATKKCKSCKTTKLVTEFAPHPRGTHGVRAACRPCVAVGNGSRKPPTPGQRARWRELNRKPAALQKQRAAVRRWQAENPAATQAMNKLNYAVRRGAVTRASCCQIAGCNATKQIVAHHHDYSKPLDVLWICRKHHRELHNGVELAPIAGVPARLLGVPPTHTAVRRPAAMTTRQKFSTTSK
jgi:hypothetical protein